MIASAAAGGSCFGTEAGMGELLREGLDSHFGHVSPDTKRQGQGRRSLRALSTRTTFDSIYSSHGMANEPKPLDVPRLQ